METVTIGIASLGRPSLVRTLQSLCSITVPAGLAIEIVVADDDPGGGAAARVESGAPWSVPVRVVAVGAGNISSARNACLDAARGSLMAFVDDDEWVEPDWLVRLLAALDEFDAEVVIGPVFPVYPAGTPDWLVQANPLHVDWGRRGRKVDTGRSGNVLFRRARVERLGLRFDPALGKTGGEDTDFFHRLHRAGAVIVVTDDARIHEEAPAARLAPAYLRLRAIRSGQSYARFRLSGRRGLDAGGLGFHCDAAAKMLAGFLAASLLRPLSRARSMAFAQKAWLNLGKLRQATGRDLPSMY
ncbi:MAG: glycosyltransferase family 2 protein [Rhizobiales bacterium]|nr:glycosyltransferase family 2 protein [Hyphomicrobiales bacterium]